MGIYSRFILPTLIDLAMRNADAAAKRSEVIPTARGAVLEIGIGSGRNFPFYSGEVTLLYGVDPSPQLLAMARRRREQVHCRVDLSCHSAEELPVASGSMDTVVSTWTLCSIPDVARALEEIKRVLRPGGQFLFIEHGLSPDPKVQAWQQRINPMWRRVAGGCHVDRKIDALITAAGFEIARLQTTYLRGPRPMTYTYAGSARR